MALAGNIKEFGLADIFQIVSLQQKTGVLTIKSSEGNVTVLLENGLIVGDVSDFDDLEKWTDQINNYTLLAGASGFFDAILTKLKLEKTLTQPIQEVFGENALFIMGSTYPKSIDFF